MVKRADPLDSVFGALADPTRRAIIARLAHGETSVSDLAEPFDVSLPAVTKHLSVLRRAGIVEDRKVGRVRMCRLSPEPLRRVEGWVAQQRLFWDQRLDGLAAHLEAKEEIVSDDAVLRLRRTIKAPRERVFRAWTDPDQLRAWWGPGLFTTPAAEVDLRPGGTYRLVMQPEVGEPLLLTGTFREVVPPARLVYTWRWEIGVPDLHESVVTVEFREVDGGTEVDLVHEHAPGSVLDPYQLGWESGLDKLAAMLT